MSRASAKPPRLSAKPTARIKSFGSQANQSTASVATTNERRSFARAAFCKDTNGLRGGLPAGRIFVCVLIRAAFLRTKLSQIQYRRARTTARIGPAQSQRDCATGDGGPCCAGCDEQVP